MSIDYLGAYMIRLPHSREGQLMLSQICDLSERAKASLLLAQALHPVRLPKSKRERFPTVDCAREPSGAREEDTAIEGVSGVSQAAQKALGTS